MPTSPISYALPRENLDSDEDWSRISDRKAKKRLQNRLAQREYRRRTREHVEELEAELNEYRRQAHELRGGSTQGARPNSDTKGSPAPSSQADVEQAPTQQAQPQPPTQSQPQPQHQQWLQHHHNASTTSSVAPSLLQPARPSSSTQQDAEMATTTSTRGASLENPTLGHPAFHASEPPQAPASQAPDRMYHPGASLFLPVDMEDDGSGSGSGSGSGTYTGGDDFFDGLNSNFPLLTGQSPLSLAHPAIPPHVPASEAQMQAPDARDGTASNRSSANRDSANIWDLLPAAHVPLEEHFDFLLDWVQHAGFDSLDHLFEVWYTGDFDEASPLRQEQRLSRHRGLTTLLARLRESSHWSRWERRGYEKETLQGAEDILCAEFSALANHAEFGRLVEAFKTHSDRQKVETTKSLKRCVQDELPQLRTLLTAATANSSKTRRHANRKAVDIATLVLSVAGSVPDADLLVAVQGIIQDGGRTRDNISFSGPC